MLRKFYQKLKIQTNQGPAVSNSVYLARFVLRKPLTNHLVNGLLINKEIAENEESKLQMSLGQLIVKIIILSFTQVQGLSNEFILPQLSHINHFLLTFQCLLGTYPELISIIETIE